MLVFYISNPCSIVNDVIFNNRVTLTDKSALHDSMRSLQTMLNDFLKEYR